MSSVGFTGMYVEEVEAIELFTMNYQITDNKLPPIRTIEGNNYASSQIKITLALYPALYAKNIPECVLPFSLTDSLCLNVG